MTTYNPQNTTPPARLGRYRLLVGAAKAGAANPPHGIGSRTKTDCDELIRLAEKVAGLEDWRMSTATDLKAIVEVIQQVKLLMALSIGCGGLSIISLVLALVSMIERNF
jgi:hypothetical protein